MKLAQLTPFDEIIDVRSPAEFAQDHIPGAVNHPVLDDAQRAEIGTLHKQVSEFAAKRLGAAMVSENIARHLRASFHDKPREWRPLIYCWRGGARSSAMAHVLERIGWHVSRLDGGYKAYRRMVIDALAQRPIELQFRVICGMTGTGKSRLLNALQAEGAQVLDLEALAAHKGSVLGNLPDKPQPSQKLFESRLWQALRSFDTTRPVYVESESKRIGALRVPEALIAAMWRGTPWVLEASLPVRVALLKEDYAHFLHDPAGLLAQLDTLVHLHGRAVIAEWHALANAGAWDSLIELLLVNHYDPSYTRAIRRHSPTLASSPAVTADDPAPATYRRLARHILAHDARPATCNQQAL